MDCLSKLYPARCSRILLRWISLGCAAGLVTGCAVDPAPPGSRFVVTAPVAEFYKNGPAQAASFQMEALRNLPGQDTGPDFQLLKGAAVTMLKREFGFSRVTTEDGVVGYVANEQLKVAPLMTRAATAVEPRRSKRSSAPTRSAPRMQREEQLDLSDIPFPLPS